MKSRHNKSSSYTLGLPAREIERFYARVDAVRNRKRAFPNNVDEFRSLLERRYREGQK